MARSSLRGKVLPAEVHSRRASCFCMVIVTIVTALWDGLGPEYHTRGTREGTQIGRPPTRYIRAWYAKVCGEGRQRFPSCARQSLMGCRPDVIPQALACG